MSGGLFAREQGDGAETVVLLHGFGTTHCVWDGISAALAGRARILAFDLPGHGKSLDFSGGTSPRAAAAAIAEATGRKAQGAVHLVGHSMGGAIATLIALANPALVVSLTLLAPGGFGPEINHRLLKRYAAARTGDDLLCVLEAMSGWNHAIPEKVLHDYSAMRALPGQSERLVAIAETMARDGRQGVIPVESLSGIAIPVSLLWGLQDCVLPARQAHDLPARFNVQLFEETGHMLPYERPLEVERAILRNLG